MDKITQERVAELYKEKSNLCDDFSNINRYNLVVGYSTPTDIHHNVYIPLTSVSNSFLTEVKDLTEKYIKERIEEIDEELKQL